MKDDALDALLDALRQSGNEDVAEWVVQREAVRTILAAANLTDNTGHCTTCNAPRGAHFRACSMMAARRKLTDRTSRELAAQDSKDALGEALAENRRWGNRPPPEEPPNDTADLRPLIAPTTEATRAEARHAATGSYCDHDGMHTLRDGRNKGSVWCPKCFKTLDEIREAAERHRNRQA